MTDISKKNKKRILFITTQLPLPTDSGGKIVTYSHLETCLQLCNVDLFAFYDRKQIDESDIRKKMNSDIVLSKVDNCYLLNNWIKTDKHKLNSLFFAIMSLFFFKPYKILKFLNFKAFFRLRKLYLEKEYDLIVVDQLPAICNVPNIIRKSSKLYLLTHNAEYQVVHEQLKEISGLLKKLYYSFEYWKLKLFERKIYKQLKNIVFISDDDSNLFAEIDLNRFIVPFYIPFFFNIKQKQNYGLNNRVLLFGSWSWGPNKNGLKWFVNEVFPKLGKDIKVDVVGGNLPSDLCQMINDSNVSGKAAIYYHGRVDCLDSYFEKSSVVVIPLHSGSGIKIKTIESIARAVPTIGTSHSIQGLKKLKKDIVICDDPNFMAKEIEVLAGSEILRRNQAQNLKESFDSKLWEKSKLEFSNFLQSI